LTCSGRLIKQLPLESESITISLVLTAVKFSADKHKTQRRKGAEGSPYINHPIDIAETLWNLGGVRDISVIISAILHDTVEDTETTLSEIEEYFGPVVRSIVQEVTDDKTLPKPERKRLQIEHAPYLSTSAKQIKLADKISNISDVAFAPPAHWSHQRRVNYLTWAESVVGGQTAAGTALARTRVTPKGRNNTWQIPFWSPELQVALVR
jgi:guanosine-3',5'-bis(diphosphate) 3'-pyrophosphohydrolase